MLLHNILCERVCVCECVINHYITVPEEEDIYEHADEVISSQQDLQT